MTPVITFVWSDRWM